MNGGKLLEKDVTDAMATWLLTSTSYVGGKGSLWISNLGVITGLISHVVDAKDE